MRAWNGFTLIELLVVIAIIAIMSAIMRPALTTAVDRGNIASCQSNLTRVGIAMREYAEDRGRYPGDFSTLLDDNYLDDPEALRCVKTGQSYFFRPPTDHAEGTTPVAACISPASHRPRPHGQGKAIAELLVNGRTRIDRLP